jgi:hypothetical protein
MLDPEPRAAAIEETILPQLQPLGGSKWARFYTGAALRRAEPVINIQADSVIDALGRISRIDESPEPLLPADETVFSLEAGEGTALGQFLTGPLNIALQSGDFDHLAGPALSPRQTDVLARLGRLRDYMAMTAPRAFRQVISVDFPTDSAPGPAVRLVADRLRVPVQSQSAAIAVLPVRQFERFALVNRASLTVWLRAKRFTVVEPERVKLSELLELFGAAPAVLLADPRQAGLLGLCNPGTKILEIAPEGWLSATGRYLSSMFGLAWQAFLAAPPSYPLRGALPFGSLVPCSYEISIRELALALQTTLDS